MWEDAKSAFYCGARIPASTNTPQILQACHHNRLVEWLRTVSKDLFSEILRNSLGSVMTVMTLPDELAPELLGLVQQTPKIVATDCRNRHSPQPSFDS